MDYEGQSLLAELRSDFEEVCGSSFYSFYCPILYRDETVDLCKAHIVNRAFPGVRRHWTVQRADVDNFYGSFFEAEFIKIQYQGTMDAESCFVEKEMATKFSPEILLRGKSVPYYRSTAARVGPNHSKIQLDTATGSVDLCLKLSPEDVATTSDEDWEIRVGKDLRLHALVSLLKAAHLTLFKLLGYRYALSAGGHFLGWTILGEFFLKNKSLSKFVVLENARNHFKKFANLVRPVSGTSIGYEGTATDGICIICASSSRLPWAFLVFVRTTDAVHAVLTPIFEHEAGIERFMNFLQCDGARIEGLRCQFDGSTFKMWPKPTVFSWPEGHFES